MVGTKKQNEKIQSFTDLSDWKESHKLLLGVYENISGFPKSEIYELIGQLRRSVVSITSNIVESFSRRTRKDKVNFYFIVIGYLSEPASQLIIAHDTNYYLNDVKFHDLNKQCVVSRLAQISTGQSR